MSKIIDYFDLNKRSAKKPNIIIEPDTPPVLTPEEENVLRNRKRREEVHKPEDKIVQDQPIGVSPSIEQISEWIERTARAKKLGEKLIFDKETGRLITVSLDDPRANETIEVFLEVDATRFGGNVEDVTPTEKPNKISSTNTNISLWKQLVMYLGILIGVTFSSYILQSTSNAIHSVSISISTILLSAIIALAIMPNVYEKALKPDAPFLVQFGLFVQNGVFWSILLEIISKKL